MNASDLARALDGHRHGAEWIARCPAHDDHDPSLSITEKNGKVLFVCRAGCAQAAIVNALRQRGFWPEPGSGTGDGGGIVATYDYRDQHGALRYQVCRLKPDPENPDRKKRKPFRQRRPNGAPDAWLWNMTGIEPLPYRLPELLGDPEGTVFVAEGEKDCNNLGDRGLVATCNHGGAGKWRPEISR
jgi:hypothetical protein